MDWITMSDPEEEVTNIDWIITILPGTKKYYRNPYPDIK